MTRIDHDKQNRWGKTKTEQPRSRIAAAPLMKTLRGVLKSALKKRPAQEKKPDLRELCKNCDQKVLPKNMIRHYFLCHDLIDCPICNEPHTGQKKLGRHVKKRHGHRAYRKFKVSM
jgi:hypothetical protein